jgi:crotonobetainyl-CoA:carnitine CoA-transferase CaiB-like acyl-CoA transferase
MKKLLFFAAFVAVSLSSFPATRNFLTPGDWDLNRRLRVRGDSQLRVHVTHIWPCKDGYVMWRYAGGANARRHNAPLIAWMTDEGGTDDWLKNLDWDDFSHYATNQDVVDRMEKQTARFFSKHTKAEMMAGAIRYRVALYPVSTVVDLLESPQLAYRDFWTQVEHPELGTAITYPGKWANNSEASPGIRCRAPLIGEHNGQIYTKELGFSHKQLLELKQAGVV